MRRAKLLFNFTGLSAYYGLILGPILGIMDYLIVYRFLISLYIIYFAVLGAAIGVFLGGVNGFIVAITTLILGDGLRNNSVSARRYRITLLVVSIAATLVRGYLVFNDQYLTYSEVKNSDGLIDLVLLPALLATAAAGYVSQSIAIWHLSQFRTKP